MNRRRVKKAIRNNNWLYSCISAEDRAEGGSCLHRNSYECRDQARHEIRVFGHGLPCTCSSFDMDVAITWNQPPSVWIDARAYRARRRRRVRRG